MTFRRSKACHKFLVAPYSIQYSSLTSSLRLTSHKPHNLCHMGNPLRSPPPGKYLSSLSDLTHQKQHGLLLCLLDTCKQHNHSENRRPSPTSCTTQIWHQKHTISKEPWLYIEETIFMLLHKLFNWHQKYHRMQSELLNKVALKEYPEVKDSCELCLHI
jgi:hypothetical protein